MKTPIIDFVRAYAERDVIRFHMPGHKGKNFTGYEKYDITEVAGADVLYSAEGIIRESEQNASELFSTLRTYYSTEGSTLAIKAMLKLATDKSRFDGDTPVVLAGRNAHKSFVSACALIGIEPVWIYPEEQEHLSVCSITPDAVADELNKMEKAPSAVYITSPDYLGNISDVRGISEVCKKYGIPLLVDNAHGAYLNFLVPSQHPIALGAAMCADSAHKTLPCLTGGAYLHISKDYPEYCDACELALSTFASTSPSYLILQSLDLCNAELSGDYRSKLSSCISAIDAIKQKIRALGFVVMDTEPLKITLSPISFGYTGEALAGYLRKCGIEAEFADSEFTVLMITPENSSAELDYLYESLARLERREPIDINYSLSLPIAKQAMTVRNAVFSRHETIDIHCAVGRICGTSTVSCPPAIPIVVSGEEITEQAVQMLEKYGIKEIEAVVQ